MTNAPPETPRWSRLAAVALTLASCTGLAGPVGAEPQRSPRRLLETALAGVDLGAVLAGAEQRHPFDLLADPRTLDPDQRAAFLSAAERELTTGWSTLPVTTFLLYDREGDRRTIERLASQRRNKLGLLLLGETIEGQGRFADAIADGVWLICEESFWGTPAHLGAEQRGLPDVEKPIVELFSAETAALLAWTDHLVGARLDAVHPRLRQRLRLEVDRRVLTPALERDDFWWLGFGSRSVNNWNPWINSNWLTAVLLLEQDPARRARAVAKIARSLDRFIDAYPDDGGCDEGPSYWGHAAASLYEALAILKGATGGRVDVFGAPVVRAMARFITRAYIKDEFFVDIGDAAARVRPSPELVYGYGRAVGDEGVAAFGAWLARRRGPFGPKDVGNSGTPGRSVPALALGRELASAPAAEPLDGEVWLPDLQLAAAREKPGTTSGLYFAAWGGHNGQSHNHNDVGNVVVYGDGRPLLVDAGVGDYTAQTFSSRRYEIWTMQSGWHNLPSINGADQQAGEEFRARDVSFRAAPDRVSFALDVAAAWPASAQVSSWRRTVTLDRRRGEVVIGEDYRLDACAEPVRLNFLTALLPDVSQAGRVLLAEPGGGAHELRYDPNLFTARLEEKAITDRRLGDVWGERLRRIVLTAASCSSRGSHTIVVRRSPGGPAGAATGYHPKGER
jgi:hypothetical protein